MSSRKVVYLKYLYFSNVVKKRLNKIPGINFELPRRSLPNEGVVISLMGPDGAGKSTQTKLITKEFKKKVDVKFIYMRSEEPRLNSSHVRSSYAVFCLKKKKVFYPSTYSWDLE